MHSIKLRKHIFQNTIVLITLSLLCLIGAGLIHKSFTKPSLNISKQDSALNLNQNFLTFMSLGNKRAIADSLWIQTLLESDLEHYSNRDLNSWMFLRFSNISTLDPLFYENYIFGGQLLSIAKDDVLGAEELFAKGLQFYPDDFDLNYYSGFNLYFEMKDFKKGYERLKRIENHPKANWSLKILVNKLNFENTHDYQTTIDFIKVSLNSTKDDFLKEKLNHDLYSIIAQRDLECLNNKKSNCSNTDYEGIPYLFKNGKWTAQKPFKKFKIHLTE